MSRAKQPRTGFPMANFKKKQDDKNLKILRELASLCCNKQCFDCYQKGPTYINMTIGSFVCTSCSGLLRGLNPPHRVKSISMATFTTDEIDFVKARGNEYCRSVWMGRYDKGKGLDEGSFKDETQMKDYLNLKYEKKRWYVSPSEVVKTADSHACRSTANNNTAAAQQPEAAIVKEPVAVGGHQARSRPVNRPPENARAQSKATLFDLDTDPFAFPGPKEPAQLAHPLGAGGFANFADFESHCVQTASGPAPVQGTGPLKPTSTVDNQNLFAPTPVVSENSGTNVDKYSALAELDELFRSDASSSTAIVGGQGMTPPLTDNFLFDANPVDGGLFGRSPVGTFDATGGRPASNPFLTPAAIPADRDNNLFASLDPFQNQKLSHGALNGTEKTHTNNAQSSWNPFM